MSRSRRNKKKGWNNSINIIPSKKKSKIKTRILHDGEREYSSKRMKRPKPEDIRNVRVDFLLK